MRLENHPTVQAYRQHLAEREQKPETIGAEWLKSEIMAAGAEDVGLVNLDRESMAPYRAELWEVMPTARTLAVLVFKVNRHSLRSTAHSVADNEFKHAWMHANESARKAVVRLLRQGVQAVNMPAGFPYEADRWPGKMWLTCDKHFAAEAGLGHMGLNRLLLHPQFGAGVFLGSTLLDRACDGYDEPIDFNPCVKCGLCVKVCPVGAVKASDGFDFMACYSHNYRERLGGFQDWVEQLTDSHNRSAYRRRVSDSETISMWQNLAIGAQTRCDRCMAVCPAGVEAIGEYVDDRKAYAQNYVNRFVELAETVYVVKKSDAEQHVKRRFPAKTAKPISNGIRPDSAEGFLTSLPIAFQPNQSEGLDARYHFIFTGEENVASTVTISNKTIAIEEGCQGEPDLVITADARAWIDFLAQETNLVWALVARKIRLKGSPKLMKAFAGCFPL